MLKFIWNKNPFLLTSLLCLQFAISPSAFADTSWADILKPLVKDVIVPGANAGMKKLLEKRGVAKTDQSASNTTTTTNTDTSLNTMPEEPMSSNSTPSTTPEEAPSTSATASTTSASPPPPVETP